MRCRETSKAYIEHDFPIEGPNKIAQKEGNAKKPVCRMHKTSASSVETSSRGGRGVWATCSEWEGQDRMMGTHRVSL